jgi:hypothetical protein
LRHHPIPRAWLGFSTNTRPTIASAQKWRETEQRLTECLAHLNRAVFIFHSPMDNTVSIDNADTIFAAAKQSLFHLPMSIIC